MLDLEADYFAEIKPSPQKKKAPLPKSAVKEEELKVASSPIPHIEEVVDSERVYHLFHPDYSVTNPLGNKYYVELNGKEQELIMENGIVKTRKEKIKETLIKSGFVFMFEA